MPEWSSGVTSVRLRSGFDEVALGAEFTNRNVLGGLEWTTHATIVRWEPESAIAWRVEENWAVWSLLLESTEAGTRPPRFVVVGSGFIEAGYRRFIERRLREEFGFEGTPVQIDVRARAKRKDR